MAKITKITAQKKPGRVNVFIDGVFGFAVSEAAVIDLNLYRGRELKDSEILKIKESDSLSKCLDRAYHLLSFRPRSEAEIRERLLGKSEAEVVEEAIVRLKKSNYINDAEFADFWLQSRLSSRGPAALRSELRYKKIAPEIIETALAGIGSDYFLNSAKDLILSKSKYQNISKKEAYKKITPFLLRRGYSYEIIKKAIDSL